MTIDAGNSMNRQELTARGHEGGPPALVVRGASMRFGPRLVLDDVDLTVERGEVHALVGANGSGKSTFVKIVCGNHVPTAVTEFSLTGVPVPVPATVAGMQSRGVRVVYQELGLVEELSILENIVGTPSKSVTWSRSMSDNTASPLKRGNNVMPAPDSTAALSPQVSPKAW